MVGQNINRIRQNPDNANAPENSTGDLNNQYNAHGGSNQNLNRQDSAVTQKNRMS